MRLQTLRLIVTNKKTDINCDTKGACAQNTGTLARFLMRKGCSYARRSTET